MKQDIEIKYQQIKKKKVSGEQYHCIPFRIQIEIFGSYRRLTGNFNLLHRASMSSLLAVLEKKKKAFPSDIQVTRNTGWETLS